MIPFDAIQTAREKVKAEAKEEVRQKKRDPYTALLTPGANIVMKDLGAVLTKTASEGAVEMRLGVDHATALYARQPHSDETPGEKTRSWPIELVKAPTMPVGLRTGLTKVIEDVARLQGRDVPPQQPQFEL